MTLVVGLVATACGSGTPVQQQTRLTVSAAADLMPAFSEIGMLYEYETGTEVAFNFGSTGQLTQQIEQGAPVDLFAAANASFIDELEKKGLTIPETRAVYAQGRITIWTRNDSGLQLNRLEDLTRPDVKRLAIANPDHAPYGMAAREALQRAGVWEAARGKLVFGENVSQTLQFAESGNVDAAIVALSLSINSNGTWKLIPAELHNPLNQTLAVLKGASNEAGARKFAAFVNGPEGRSVMRRYGFVLPGEEPAP
ncbi:MAG TPA: molybdate ABC transporter substrate-binding protein [Blastocatellia bacterium]|nr:molybdate ABC transporter substrate-binding protein [Blastocatellia bacterium]